MNIWFTSDTHFSHLNIIRFCNRPYDTIEEMNEKLIENWNKNVKQNDIIYHLGDVSFKPIDDELIYKRLAGKKFLIPGNHDKDFSKIKNYFTILPNIFELKWNKLKYILCHFPIADWNQITRNSKHFYGHCHGNKINGLTNDAKLIDSAIEIGVDIWNYEPVNLDILNSYVNKEKT